MKLQVNVTSLLRTNAQVPLNLAAPPRVIAVLLLLRLSQLGLLILFGGCWTRLGSESFGLSLHHQASDRDVGTVLHLPR